MMRDLRKSAILSSNFTALLGACAGPEGEMAARDAGEGLARVGKS